jgi:hypothetical protein
MKSHAALIDWLMLFLLSCKTPLQDATLVNAYWIVVP